MYTVVPVGGIVHGAPALLRRTSPWPRLVQSGSHVHQRQIRMANPLGRDLISSTAQCGDTTEMGT
ncbi:hypothetical protein E2C01_007222 [Portunus trituberculatus]|uniref:Uncharacterized protein n=1 Tax=Portunus trituberculatus TaxID=210409 RepID=A0A5B7D0C4_PORTR|nr:hypothetical protein [Portunus trituberculatus]